MLSLSVRIRHRLRWYYVSSDFLLTSLAIFLFNIIRWQRATDWAPSLAEYYQMPTIWGGQIIFPLIMMGIYWLSGYYNHVDQRSRAQEFLTTFSSTLVGAFVVFFAALVNDVPHRRLVAAEQIAILWTLLFICVYSGRFLITRLEVRRIHNRHKFHEALVIGTDEKAVDLANRINSLPKGMGLKVVGFVKVRPSDEVCPKCLELEILEMDKLAEITSSRALSNMILSPGLEKSPMLSEIIRQCMPLDMMLYLSPTIESAVLTTKRQFNVAGEPLINITTANISDSVWNVKRVCDVVLSSLALVVGLPVLGVIALAIKRDDKGPVFYRQERVGYHGRDFKIIKFRTMRTDAEKHDGPRLTTDDDPRITKVGRFLRKYRLDELPQFVNVLRGDMSLVGPRPERRHFANQIAERVPLYPMIYQVRPGITSWGMVRFGYASNIDQMVERLRYDLFYLENISISTDLKILLHTINTVVSGQGK